MFEVQAYPYDRWARFTRRQAAELRAWARSAPLAALAEGTDAAAALLGVRPAWALGTPGIGPIELGGRVAVLFEDAAGARAALAIDVPLASAITDRALGGDGLGLEGVTGVPSEVERGVLAYTLARWIAGSRWRVAAVLATGAGIIEALGADPVLRWPLELELGAARGGACLLAPQGQTPAPGRSRRRFVGDLRAELIVGGGTAELAPRDLASLARGDIVVLDESELTLAAGRLAGAVRVCGARAFRATLEAGVLRIDREELGAETTEGIVDSPDRSLDKIAHVPVTLTLELARFTLPLAEIASLAPGEIVRTGRAIGERVILRAGEREIAAGELVDVDGEIGVRLLELLG